MHIHVELWILLREKLGGEFQSLSEMRSVATLETEEGLTIIDLFRRLATDYPLIAENIFNREDGKFYPSLNVIVTHQDQLISPFNIEESILKDGDKIMVIPLYAGG